MAYLSDVRLRREAVPSFERYPFSLPAVRGLHRLELHPAVTYLVGENGSGKSTLLEGIAVSLGFNAEGGSLGEVEFSTHASHSELHEYLDARPGRPRHGFFLRAESLFNLATEIDRLDQEPWARALPKRAIDYFGGRSLHEQSHGESFLAVFQNKLHGGMLVLLDEPEAALSPIRQMSFLTLLHRHARSGAQFVIASHSPIVLAYPDAWIYQFGEEGVRRTAYEETEHYQVYRDFLNHRERSLRVLLGNEE
ncbi:MAG: AAA family ATPase [Gemmatimonadetes bacterium]|nr:AAA family ATPase [Gemmatimonadota bacterium]